MPFTRQLGQIDDRIGMCPYRRNIAKDFGKGRPSKVADMRREVRLVPVSSLGHDRLRLQARYSLPPPLSALR